ncbi:unnamed protein product [Linum trigynum]|uniref:Pentacotripeptide-repeat region of PRORP domain-containing protein n=1 Tax=Linum trigynum TaxID=586398 RepID=A0AAV2CDN1_9ROSI
MAKGQALSSFFRVAVLRSKTPSAGPVAVPPTTTNDGLQLCAPIINACSATKRSAKTSKKCSTPALATPSSAATIAACCSPASSSTTEGSVKTLKKCSLKSKQNPASASSTLPDSKMEASSNGSDDAPLELTGDLTTIMIDTVSDLWPNSKGASEETSSEIRLDIPFFPNLTSADISSQRKDVRRASKDKFIFSSGQEHHVQRIARTCAEKLGPEQTLNVFGKLRQGTGVKEYDALIKSCLKIARETKDDEIISKQMSVCFHLLTMMKEQGFQIEENTYGPVLLYLIDKSMVQEFHSLHQTIKTENPSSLARLGYYEMLQYIRVGDEQKIQELCSAISLGCETKNLRIHENYFIALCESNRKNDILPLLDVIDVTRFESVEHISTIFNTFGRLSLESSAMKFLLACKSCDNDAEKISTLVCSYATGIPNLEVEDVILKFKELHSELGIKPSMGSYEQLIAYCCDKLKVYVALDLVDQIYEDQLSLSMDTFCKLLDAIDESSDYILVRRMYSLLSNHDLQPTIDTFRKLITLSVRIKDFDLAYAMLEDLKNRGFKPTATMFNVIMGGFFRQKNTYSALKVLKDMELADVKPDSQTYSYLIGNCVSEDQIVKYHEKMQLDVVKSTKHVPMALVNAYAASGNFEKAKQVLLDKTTVDEDVKSVLVSALACHGQFFDALAIYKEFKDAGNNITSKAVRNLIEQFPSDGEISELLALLEEVHDSEYWVDACCRVVIHCIRNKHSSCLYDLLKLLMEKFSDDEVTMEVLFDEFFATIADTERPDLEIGLKLLGIIKCELGVSPSRKSLDFLLHTCGRAKDLAHARSVWKEYELAGLPYNVLSYLRMYQVLLACGSHTTAKSFLTKIPKDDPHVRMIIVACQVTYKSKPRKK